MADADVPAAHANAEGVLPSTPGDVVAPAVALAEPAFDAAGAARGETVATLGVEAIPPVQGPAIPTEATPAVDALLPVPEASKETAREQQPTTAVTVALAADVPPASGDAIDASATGEVPSDAPVGSKAPAADDAGALPEKTPSATAGGTVDPGPGAGPPTMDGDPAVVTLSSETASSPDDAAIVAAAAPTAATAPVEGVGASEAPPPPPADLTLTPAPPEGTALPEKALSETPTTAATPAVPNGATIALAAGGDGGDGGNGVPDSKAIDPLAAPPIAVPSRGGSGADEGGAPIASPADVPAAPADAEGVLPSTPGDVVAPAVALAEPAFDAAGAARGETVATLGVEAIPPVQGPAIPTEAAPAVDALLPVPGAGKETAREQQPTTAVTVALAADVPPASGPTADVIDAPATGEVPSDAPVGSKAPAADDAGALPEKTPSATAGGTVDPGPGAGPPTMDGDPAVVTLSSETASSPDDAAIVAAAAPTAATAPVESVGASEALLQPQKAESRPMKTAAPASSVAAPPATHHPMPPFAAAAAAVALDPPHRAELAAIWGTEAAVLRQSAAAAHGSGAAAARQLSHVDTGEMGDGMAPAEPGMAHPMPPPPPPAMPMFGGEGSLAAMASVAAAGGPSLQSPFLAFLAFLASGGVGAVGGSLMTPGGGGGPETARERFLRLRVHELEGALAQARRDVAQLMRSARETRDAALERRLAALEASSAVARRSDAAVGGWSSAPLVSGVEHSRSHMVTHGSPVGFEPYGTRGMGDDDGGTGRGGFPRVGAVGSGRSAVTHRGRYPPPIAQSDDGGGEDDYGGDDHGGDQGRGRGMYDDDGGDGVAGAPAGALSQLSPGPAYSDSPVRRSGGGVCWDAVPRTTPPGSGPSHAPGRTRPASARPGGGIFDAGMAGGGRADGRVPVPTSQRDVVLIAAAQRRVAAQAATGAALAGARADYAAQRRAQRDRHLALQASQASQASQLQAMTPGAGAGEPGVGGVAASPSIEASADASAMTPAVPVIDMAVAPATADPAEPAAQGLATAP